MWNRNNITRREVLKAGAAALAVPYFVPASVLGLGARSAPSERITLGIIGVGNMGGGHLSAFLGMPEVQVVAICDVDAVKRYDACGKVEEQYGGETTAGTFTGCDTWKPFL